MTLTMQAEDDSSDVVTGVTDALDVMREAVGAVGIATGLAFIKGAEDLQAYGLQIQRIAFITNETAQESSRLVSAFEGQGLSADQAASMVQRLQMRLGTMEAQQRSAAAAHKVSSTALDILGISTRDAAGHTLNMSQILPQIIDKLHGMTDASERARIGQQLFGRNWGQLAPLIEAGGAAFTKAMGDADKFGLVLTEHDVKAAHEAEVAHMHLTESVQGIGNALGAVAMPYITQWTEALANLIARVQALNPHTLQMIVHIIGLVAVAATLVGGLSAITEVLGPLTAVFGPTGQAAVRGFMVALGGVLGPVLLVAAAALVLYEAYQNVGAVHRALEPYVRTLMAAFNEASSVWSHTHDVASTFKDIMDQLNAPVGLTAAIIGTVSAVMSNWQGILGIVGPLVAGIAIAWVAWNVATTAWAVIMAVTAGVQMAIYIVRLGLAIASLGPVTALQWAWNFAMSANPIGLIVIGIGLLIGIIILLVMHKKEVIAVLQNLWAQMQAFAGWIGGFLVATWNSLTTTIATFFTGIVTTALSGWKAFTDHPMYYIGFLVAYIPLQLMNLQNHFTLWMAQLVLATLVWAGHMANNAGIAASRFLESIRVTLNNLPGNVQIWLAAVMPRISAWAVNLALAAQQAAFNFTLAVMREWNLLPAQAFRVGVDMIQGIINGIKSMMSAGIGAIGDFVRGLIDGAHAAGHGGSPYMLFADEVGNVGIAQGVALGIHQGAGAAQTAMVSLLGGLAGSASATASVGVNPAVSMGGMAAAAAAGAMATRPGVGGGGGSSGGGIGSQPDIVIKIDSKEIAKLVFDYGAQRWKLLGGTLGSGA